MRVAGPEETDWLRELEPDALLHTKMTAARNGHQFDPDEYVARATEHAGAEATMIRHRGWLVRTESWRDEHGHWLRVRAEVDSRPGVEIRYARVLLRASGPDKSPETEAAIYGSGFEERLHLRAARIEPVDGVGTL